MTKKKTAQRKTLSRKDDPLLLGHEPLPLGDGTEEDMEELLLLTEAQAATEFFSRWKETIDPFNKYSSFFTPLIQEGESSLNRCLGEIKNYYRRYVLRDEWSEAKFVTVLDHMLLCNVYLHTDGFEKVEKLYQAGRCTSQLKEKRLRGRRRI